MTNLLRELCRCRRLLATDGEDVFVGAGVLTELIEVIFILFTLVLTNPR